MPVRTAINTEVVEPTPTTSAGVSRRSFMQRAGLGVATVFVVADGLAAYRAYDQGVLAEGRGRAFDAWQTWRTRSGPEALVGAAILAASAHNTQPWVFAISNDQIDLFADMTRSTGANDPLNRELFISLGCALENLVIAAPAHGYHPTVRLGTSNGSGPVATVMLEPASKTTPALYDAIGRRRSNRSEYRATALPAGTMEAMAALIDASVAPAKLAWLVNDQQRQQFGALLLDAAREHVADGEQSMASFAWWRSDWDAIQRHKDGLTIDGVGLSPMVRTLGKILPATSRASADKTFIDRTKLQADSAAAFGIVTVDDPYSLTSQIAGGRLLQRLHLWTTANGLGFQHMNPITERIDRLRQQGQVSPFEQSLAGLVGSGTLGAFRIGTPKVAAIRSPRRPVKEVLK